MFHTTEGIILHNVKYADKKIISKIYTRHFGIISVNYSITKSTKTNISNSLLQPLSQIEIEISFKENRDIHQLKEAKISYQYQTLHSNFYKLCIAQFINEVLLKSLKEQTKNDELFDFITSLFRWLDKANEGFSGMHLYFLFNLSRYLGFYPLNNFDKQHPYFHLIEGQFQSYKSEFPLGLNEEVSALFSTLFNADLSSNILTTKANRDVLLEILMLYYKYHLPGFNHLKSFYVLKETLNG